MPKHYRWIKDLNVKHRTPAFLVEIRSHSRISLIKQKVPIIKERIDKFHQEQKRAQAMFKNKP